MILKNFFLISGIAFSSLTPFESSGQKQTLDEYNKDNQWVYDDFKDFLMKRGNPYQKGEIHAQVWSVEYRPVPDLLEFVKGNEKFFDSNIDGLQGKDFYKSIPRNIFKKFCIVEKLPQEEQLKLAQKYTLNLMEVMHNEYWKCY